MLVWSGSFLVILIGAALHLSRFLPTAAAVWAPLVGAPVLQSVLAHFSERHRVLRWIIFPVGVAWVASALGFMLDYGLIFVPVGALWIVGALRMGPLRRG